MLETLRHFTKTKPIVIYLFPRNDLKNQFKDSGINVHCINAENKSLIYKVKEFNKLVKTENPALIVSTLFKSDLIARLAQPFNRLPLVGTFVNDSYSDSRYGFFNLWKKVKLRSYQFLDMMTSKAHHSFIANGESIRTSNAKALSIDAEKIVVIHRGRDPEKFKPPATRNLSHKKFLAIGRLIHRKGHTYLIKAMKKVVEKYPDSTLTIAGDGPERSKLEKTAATLELQKHIQFTGTVQQVEDLLNRSSYFILPSHYEGFSGALIEAMLSEIPIIASAIPMNQEAVIHQETAFLFEPGNSEKLAEAMLWMIENPDKAGEMAKKARNHALQEFNIKKIAARYEEYLLSVIPQTNKQINP